MTIDLTTLWGVLGTILGVALTFGMVWSQIQRGKQVDLRGTISDLQKVNAGHEVTMAYQAKEITSLQEQLNRATAANDLLATEVKQLRDLIMLNSVPIPLKEFVTDVAGRNFVAIEAVSKEVALIKEMVSRLAGKPEDGRRIEDA